MRQVPGMSPPRHLNITVASTLPASAAETVLYAFEEDAIPSLFRFIIEPIIWHPEECADELWQTFDSGPLRFDLFLQLLNTA